MVKHRLALSPIGGWSYVAYAMTILGTGSDARTSITSADDARNLKPGDDYGRWSNPWVAFHHSFMTSGQDFGFATSGEEIGGCARDITLEISVNHVFTWWA